jgi:hypothetical protein
VALAMATHTALTQMNTADRFGMGVFHAWM